VSRSAALAAARKARNKPCNPFAITINKDVPAASNRQIAKAARYRDYNHPECWQKSARMPKLLPATRRGAFAANIPKLLELLRKS